ncbi:hypothetical protein E1A91_A03G121900v1 [Gossypium mustelinum]|uniref:Root meristem growth factor 8 n=2 Tax=Gossypium TaxID=3633 RepID=A0A5D2ZVF4_GOSMU|nr:hypothetical protein ES332_A03G130700v1 [Gossypium tomentosum]TYJ42965.1 hypothetical protein E1A91_A03G121900v1 [Gossypium mustelinum]
MELIGGIFIAVFCFSFFALQTTCTSLQIQLQSSSEQGKGVELTPPTVQLPRKLRFAEEVAKQLQGNVAQAHSISSTKKLEDVSGKAKQKEEATVRGNRGRRQQWKEGGPDLSHYLTMDYSNVRRRRPIHNKSFPVAP